MIIVRKMLPDDVESFYSLFIAQGWHKPREILEKYMVEQENGMRKVFVATERDNAIGYATLLSNDKNGAFKDKNIPTVCDFNVFKPYQRKGAGTAILDAIESHVKKYSDEICLGVGLHSGYGTAQRMYVKRGYIPDGSGVWYHDVNLAERAPCCNDDDLILYLSKKL